MKVLRVVAGLALGGALAVACSGEEGGTAGDAAGGAGAAGELPKVSAGDSQGGADGEADGELVSCGAPGVGGAGAGNGGGAGEAGASALDPHRAVSCAGKPILLNEERVAQCVMLTSCTGGRYSPEDSKHVATLGDCITGGLAFFGASTGDEHPDHWWPTPYFGDARWSTCPQTLDTCNDVLACTGFRLPNHECDEQQQARCDGDLAINCGEDGMVVDCKKVTGQAGNCQVLGAGATARAACVVKETCGEASEALRCDGDRVYQCGADGKGVGADCAQFGLKCYEMDAHSLSMEAGCAPPPSDETCSDRAYSNVGDEVRYCDPNGKRYTIDCTGGGDFTSYKQSAEEPNPDFYACRPDDCTREGYATWRDVCDGDGVHISLGDTSEDSELGATAAHAYVHCPDYGFETCHDGRCVN